MTIKLMLSRLSIRLLGDLLNIDNPYFEGVVNQIYPPELQLNKANTRDTEAPFLDLHLSIANGVVFLLKFMINAIILLIVIFRYWIVTFLAVLLGVYTFRNLLCLQSCSGLQHAK